MFGTFEPVSLIKPIQLAHADQKKECLQLESSLLLFRNGLCVHPKFICSIQQFGGGESS